MLITEWSWEDATAVARKEAREDGIEKGIEKRDQYILDLIAQ